MASVGELLRSERLRKGLQVTEIAAATKIPPDLLEAMEAGQFDLLPAGAYRRSFLRQYAHTLGLDEAATIASFHEQYLDPPVELPAPGPDPPSRFLRLAGALLALVSSVVVYQLAVNTPPTSGEERGTVAPPRPAAVAAGAPAPSPAVVAAGVPGAPTPPPAPPPQTDPVRPVRVEFSATEPVWVSVKCDGAQTFVGTLEVPQMKTFDAARQVTVLVGNAGGLTILLNGRPVGPLGGHGEIQQVELTPSGVRRMPRPPATPPGANTIPQA